MLVQVKRRYLPSVIFTRDFAFKTLKKRPHEQQQSQGAITVTTVEVEGAPSKEKNSEVSPPVSEGYESGNFDLSPQERAHLYACQYCSDTFLSRYEEYSTSIVESRFLPSSIWLGFIL